MSCLDVMYQVFGAQPYFPPYGHYHHQQQKVALYSKMQDPQGGLPGPPTIKEEEKELPPGAEYLSARCVLFMYFQGDISAVVDEHFSRALSQTPASSSPYPPSGGHKAPKADGSFPMSQRGFPASFWHSSYQSSVSSSLASALSAPHSELPFPGDSYSPSPLHGHLHHQPSPDAWYPSHHHHHPYSLGGAIGAQGSAYPRPGVHEMYGTPFDPRYSSLLVPSVRPHHRLAAGGGSVAGTGSSPCDLGGKGESWTGSAWSGSLSGSGQEIGLNLEAGLQTQDKTKDLYWF